MAKVEDVVRKPLKAFNNYELALDTGYDLEGSKQIIKNLSGVGDEEMLDYILLRRIT